MSVCVCGFVIVMQPRELKSKRLYGSSALCQRKAILMRREFAPMIALSDGCQFLELARMYKPSRPDG